ncbi:hypothetical protein FZW96_06370 [Bacillus sp. BGMRC 2118]|nr:hypothetical protein FZW96_06370 [Bacillus sp. BGMRC 2118]
MKKRGWILLVIIIVWFIGYMGPRQHDEYRKIAWNEISDSEKQHHMNSNWKRGKVKEVKWEGFLFPNEGNKSDTLMEVTFHTNVDQELGPIVYYIHPDTKEIIGHSVRK